PLTGGPLEDRISAYRPGVTRRDRVWRSRDDRQSYAGADGDADADRDGDSRSDRGRALGDLDRLERLKGDGQGARTARRREPALRRGAHGDWRNGLVHREPGRLVHRGFEGHVRALDALERPARPRQLRQAGHPAGAAVPDGHVRADAGAGPRAPHDREQRPPVRARRQDDHPRRDQGRHVRCRRDARGHSAQGDRDRDSDVEVRRLRHARAGGAVPRRLGERRDPRHRRARRDRSERVMRRMIPNNDATIDADDAPIGRVLTRREVLALLGTAGALACAPAALNAASPSGTASAAATSAASAGASVSGTVAAPSCIVRPALTEGPYFVDEKLNRTDIRTEPATGAVKPGIQLALAFNVSRVASSGCTALANAQVDVWHCDAAGVYSDASDPSFNTKGQKFLRGYQLTDANGKAPFTTIYPGWYGGRAVHIHFKIRTTNGSQVSDFTSQLFFDDSLNSEVFAQAPYNEKTGSFLRNAQ